MKNSNVEIDNKKERFYQFIANPDQADLIEVEELCKEYPYVQSLRALQARLNILQNTQNAKDVYQRAILHSTNPELFREFVYKPRVEVEEIEYIETEDYYIEEESKEIVESHSLSAELPESSRETDDSTPSPYMDDWMPYTFVWWLQKTRMEYAETYQPYSSSNLHEKRNVFNKVNSPNPLDQQIREHIFNLQEPEAKLSEQFDGSEKVFKVPHKEDSIIEKFIKEDPQIKPPSADKINLENKARKSAEDNSGFVSETLAKIYTEQGLYHKAVDTYKKLSLKYPEKSLYFANLIEKLNQKLN